MEEINEKMGKTIIMVTHDPQVASHCKRILFLKGGILLGGSAQDGNDRGLYPEILVRMKKL